MGQVARARILSDYVWDHSLAQVEALLANEPATPEPTISNKMLHNLSFSTTLRENKHGRN